MIRRRTLLPAVALAVVSTLFATAAGSLQTPEQFLGFKVGADNKLVRWDRIVDYMKLAAANSDRVRFRELGKTSQNNPFIVLEISAPDTLKNLDRYKQLERKLYFQGGAPSDAAIGAISSRTQRATASAVVQRNVAGGEIAIRAGLSEGRNRTQHERGILAMKRRPSETHLVERAGRVALDYHVGRSRQLKQNFAAARIAEIESERAFVEIVEPEKQAAIAMRDVVEEGADATRVVAVRRLNLDNVGAHVGEQPAA